MINITTRSVFWLACAAVIALTTLSGQGVAEERWVEGQHYQTLTPPVATGRSQDVVVTEFFWYGCGVSNCQRAQWCNPHQRSGMTR